MVDTDRLELPIGFGTGNLWGESETSRSLELLNAAYDAGIRYFDTARLYADGRAEGVLGQFLQGKRDEVFLTSKAGILPIRDELIDKAIGKARKAASMIGLGKPLVREPTFGHFDLSELEASLSKTLKELRTDRLDAWLMHEVRQNDLADGTVRGFLDSMVAQGRIGAYGLATMKDETETILAKAQRPFPIVQTRRSVFQSDESEGQGAVGDTLLIHHSVLTGALPTLHEKARLDADFAAQLRRDAGLDGADQEGLAGLLLAEAIDANPTGVTLFSSGSPDRIRAAARVAQDRPFAPDQIAGLRALVARMDIH